MDLASYVDVTHSENLHWLAICGSSITLSVASSVVPNYLESRLEPRSHNRARLLNETVSRVHIAYIIFLVALITSDDIDRGSNSFTWLVTLTLLLVFVLILSIILSGTTLNRINKYKNWKGALHQCRVVDGVCDTHIGGWLYWKVCFHNGLLTLIVGLLCIWLCISPSVIQHAKVKPSESEMLMNQRREYFDLFQETFKRLALQTKEQFEATVLRARDNKLNVSYWINYEGTLHQMGTTEEHATRMTFPLDKKSIIGCAFSHQNHSVQWDNNIGKGVIVSFNDKPPFEDQDCKYAEEEQRRLASIVCTTFNANGPPDTTVGICVYTESDRELFETNYHSFLRSKVEDFHKLISPALTKRYVVPR